jgi:uncharacterized membrane protein
MLIAFPLTLYAAALACFAAYHSNGDTFWFKVGYVANMVGICVALVAALPGFVDWLAIPSAKQMKRTGARHVLLNLLGLVFFTVNYFMIRDEWTSSNPNMKYSILLTATGFITAIFASALGWTMVQTYYVGIPPRPEEEPITTTFGHSDPTTTLSPVRDRDRHRPDTREPSEL